VVCVDKAPHEIPEFTRFAEEASANIEDGAVFFVTAPPGLANRRPTPLAIDQTMERMVETVRKGKVVSYLAFDRSGAPLQLALSH
jgi:hypothetical protein